MTIKIDLDTLTLAQARQMARHYGEFCDVQSAANNTLVLKLAAIIADAPPAIADRMQVALNGWSLFLNRVVDESDAKVSRIVSEPRQPNVTSH